MRRREFTLDEQYEFAKGRAYRYLGFRARSEKEVREYLTKKLTTQIVIDQTIQHLKDYNYINDDEFTDWWINQRQTHRPKSKRIIKMELKQKGISDEIIEKHLAKSTNDLEIAKQLFEKKRKTFERYTGDQYNQKVSQFLARRGFSWDIIKEILKDDSYY
jgi:regulatory protein